MTTPQQHRLSERIEAAKEFERAGDWNQALATYEDVFTYLGREGSAALTADLLRWIGTAHRERGDLELAGEAYEASLAVAQANGLRQHAAGALNCLAALTLLQGSVEAAEELYLQAGRLAAEVGDERLAAMIDQNLGMVASIRGNLSEAIVRYCSALERYRRLNDEALACQALNNLGMAHLGCEDWSAAETCFAAALQGASATGDLAMTGTVELNRAELHLRLSRFEAARHSCARSLDIFNQLRSRSGVAESYRLYGILHRELRQPERASAHFALALGLAETAQDRLLQAETRLEWALLHLELGQVGNGILYLNRALRLFGEMQAQREVLDIRQRVERMEGRYLAGVRQWCARVAGEGASYGVEHGTRVAELACRLAAQLRLSEWELTTIRVGALIHDVGHAALPAGLRDRSAIEPVSPTAEPAPARAGDAYPACGAPGPTRIERLHAIAGDVLAASLDFPAEVRAVVRGHHEHWRGTGFPDRLARERIPLGARIVAVADAYDSLLHPPPGAPAHAPAQARQLLAQLAGHVLDPHLVTAFCTLLEEEGRGKREEGPITAGA